MNVVQTWTKALKAKASKIGFAHDYSYWAW